MRVLRAVNLLGDSLYLLKPIAEYRMQNPDQEFVIGVSQGFAGDLFRRQFESLVPVEDMGKFGAGDEIIDLSAGKAANLAVHHLLKTGRRKHISECYAEILGVDCSGWGNDRTPLTGWARIERSASTEASGELGDGYVVVAPFSKSCMSRQGLRPNKMIPTERWGLTLDWMRQDMPFAVGILIGPGESWSGQLESYFASTLDNLIVLLTGAEAVITVDNGIGHIASALKCRTFIVWPPVSSVDFIGPTYNERTKLLFMRPAHVRADQLLNIMRREFTI